MTEYMFKKNEETINDVSLQKETVWINPYKLPFEMTDALCQMIISDEDI